MGSRSDFSHPPNQPPQQLKRLDGSGILERRGAWRSLVSALVWGTRGPEFKSRRPDSTGSLSP
jgi:hypothetical protein